MNTNVSRNALVAAYAVAICVDFLEICLFPLFVEGFVLPWDDITDVVVCLVLTRLIGFHIAFLPSFLMKLAPGVDIAPTWTLAVIIASRRLRVGDKPEVVVEEDKPPAMLQDRKD